MFSVPSVPISDGCSICLEPETPATGPYVVHNERHPFHQECLWQHVNTQLLSSNGGLGRFESVGCPICREEITHIQGIPVTLPIQNSILAVRGAQNQIDSSNPTPLLDLGDFHFQNDRIETALAYWTHSLAQENLTEDARSRVCAAIGNIHSQSSRYSAALPYLETAWNMDRDHPDRFRSGLNLARAYFHVGNYLNAGICAVKLIERAQPTEPELIELYFIGGVSSNEINLPQYAAYFLSLFLDNAPANHPQRERAELDLTRAIRNTPLVGAELGAHYFNQSRYSTALPYLEQVVQAHPSEVNPDVRARSQMRLGISYYYLRNYENAYRNLNEAYLSDQLTGIQKLNIYLILRLIELHSIQNRSLFFENGFAPH